MGLNNNLYISDLDGTLLQPDALLSDYARERLQRLIDAGMAFTVASARSVVSIRETLGDLRLQLPIVEFNGAYVSDYPTGRHRVIQSFEREAVEGVYAAMTGADCHPFVSFYNGDRDRSYYQKIWNEGVGWYISDRRRALDTRLEQHDRPDEAFDHHVVCLTLIGRHEVIAPVKEEIERSFAGRVRLHFYENIYQPGWWWLTIHPWRATKAHAIEILIDELGYAPGDLIVFGDHNNDIEMFQLAGRAIAVANATDELKRHADEIIGPNHGDSVIEYLMRCNGI